MRTWKTIEASNISKALRWDAEFFINPYNDFLDKLFAGWSDWVSLSAASKRLTSGHTPLRHDVSEGDTPFITVECVDPLALNLEKAKRVWAHHALGELARVCIASGDVLITIKRRIAISSAVLTDPGLMAINQDVVVMTPKPGFRPGYVAAVLNSRVGQFQALRDATEQMNPYINVTALGRLLIPLVSDRVQEEIETVVVERLKLMEQSVGGYRLAEAELLDRLGWDELRRQPVELSYTCDSANLTTSARIDAEYFQPQYDRLHKQIDKRGGIELSKMCPLATKGITPEYDADGECLAVNSQHLGPHGIKYEGLSRVRRKFFEAASKASACVRRDDVLTYATGAYVGRTNAWLLKESAVGGIDCLISRPDPRICSPGYLALFLNSPAGQAQAIRAASGSAQRHIYPRDLARFSIFLPRLKNGAVDLAWQEKLASKVEAAVEAKSGAGAKLEEAKRLVERAIMGRSIS